MAFFFRNVFYYDMRLFISLSTLGLVRIFWSNNDIFKRSLER